ncbi:Probable isochorismatase (phenazine biosynthesis) PhzD [Mycobacteroides abscessus subsp. abscessus]|uniref:isochorismatase family protein n=1 Tax=Mycobacteroides abscessus TaxID=36809 RepID=UPI0009A5E3AD|nr:isochorismatase family protein [Mycobacteroides abscessus]SKU87184.1 Probable isochorismatase (phenazine biosynthesis) PhzD [Mycobacteroides abscessus subsp. abscessus]SKY90575.1 isochorismatase (phenazine biosynthesis) PhzD [Mycobacteroides abscessus subsp. abscessus]
MTTATRGIPMIAEYDLPTVDLLPSNTATWRIDPDRAVLLIHDMQRYFLEPLPVSLRQALVRNVAATRDRSVAAGIPIAYTAQPGSMTQEQRGLLKDFWGPGMRVDEEHRQIVDPIAPDAGDWVFTKWRYSAFHRSALLERMHAAGRDQLVICGVYAHVGVLMTAVDAFTHDIETFLVADAIADFDDESHWMALEYAARRCAVLTVTGEVLT